MSTAGSASARNGGGAWVNRGIRGAVSQGNNPGSTLYAFCFSFFFLFCDVFGLLVCVSRACRPVRWHIIALLVSLCVQRL